MALVVARSNAW